MTTTVQQLIERLQLFPDDLVIKIKSGVDDNEFVITDINTEDKFVTIIISQDEEDEEDKE